MVCSEGGPTKAASTKKAAVPAKGESVPVVTDDVILGQGVVVAYITHKVGLIFGPTSAKSDDER